MTKSIVPYTTLDRARARALERRAWLASEILDSSQERWPRWQVAESPPGRALPERQMFEDSPAEALGQLARLKWQMTSLPNLLLERVTDLVLGELDRDGSKALGSSLAIKLQPLPPSAPSNLFPWRVVICSHDEGRIAGYVGGFADWLGIGVDYEEPGFVRFDGRCTADYGGLAGLVGGMLEGSQRYALTCQHVVASACGSLAAMPFPMPPPLSSSQTNVPDAVLLDSMTPCFTVPIGNAIPFTPASNPVVENLMLECVPVAQNHPDASVHIEGVLKATVSAIMVANKLLRGPLLEIIPLQKAYLFGLLKLPRNAKRVSSPGDSGGWVIEKKNHSWLGVVTAGDDRGSTYATSASFIVEYFQLVLRAQSGILAVGWPPK